MRVLVEFESVVRDLVCAFSDFNVTSYCVIKSWVPTFPLGLSSHGFHAAGGGELLEIKRVSLNYCK